MTSSSYPLPELSETTPQNISRPVRLVLEAGLFNCNTTFLDFSFTRVENSEVGSPVSDVSHLVETVTESDIVNLGYAISIIQCPEERRRILQQAWELTRQVLIVAASVRIDCQGSDAAPSGGVSEASVYVLQTRLRYGLAYSISSADGIITSSNTFQNYDREELKAYIDAVLNVDAVPVTLGIFFVFRNENQRENFCASRFLTANHRRQDILIYLACRGTTLPCPNTPIPDEINTLFGSYEQACEEANHLLSILDEPGFIARCCQQSQIGKLLPGALYVHISALSEIDPLLRLYEGYASRTFNRIDGATLIKFNIKQPKISYLLYPDFDTDPHPALEGSFQINLQTGSLSYRDYSTSDNPPVLHRKETFVTPDYPHYEKFALLTQQEAKLGLLNNSRAIGTRLGWLQCLKERGVELEGHQIVNAVGRELPLQIPKIERHRAAIVRNNLSRPMRLAVDAGFFGEKTTFFDYGCGHGGDVNRMTEQGYISAGWDPYYSPDTQQIPADVVNLGYVINVIEDIAERREALVTAWELTRQVLIVASLVLIDSRDSGQVAYGDGIITRRHTFQKYYQQEELKTYIDQVLNVDAVPVALGIYFVFRDEVQAQTFRASRFRSRTTTPRVCTRIKRFEEYQELLTPLMAFFTERGRLPIPGEIATEAELKAEFGNFRRAFEIIIQATDREEWDAIADKRRQDLLVYIALSQFGHRPKFSQLAIEVQNDIKGLFGTYKQACILADLMLFSLQKLSAIANCCQQSKIGKKQPNSLLVHVSCLEALDPMLRLYEGCASRTIGRLEEATLIKFHTKQPKISYLYYPDFDTDPHPILHTTMHIDLRDLHVSYRNYEMSDNPPILHRKETVVTPDYPGYEKFAKLSRQEEDWGLLDDFRAIETLKGWLQCLEERCATIQGNRIVWRKDADPYRIKLVQSARRARKHHEKI